MRITVQPGPVKLIFQCYSNGFRPMGDQWLELRQQLLISHDKGTRYRDAFACDHLLLFHRSLFFHIYVWSSLSADWASTGYGCQSYSACGQHNREKNGISLSLQHDSFFSSHRHFTEPIQLFKTTPMASRRSHRSASLRTARDG